MAKIRIERDFDRADGEYTVVKDKGKITMDDIFNFFHEREQTSRFDGALVCIMFRVNSERDLFPTYGDWGTSKKDAGDCQRVYIVGDGELEHCPICGGEIHIQYCPNCGEKLFGEGKL